MDAQPDQSRVPLYRAMNEALAWELDNDPKVFMMGEDIGLLGSIYQTTAGLMQRFGEQRVRDTPISEAGFVAAATGAAMSGMKPIVELMFVDFLSVCLDPLCNMAAKNAYHSNGEQPVPMVILTGIGGGYSDGSQHSQCLYATVAHLPGIKLVVPSNARDARGLLHAAVADPNPVIYMFHKKLTGMGWYDPVEAASVPLPSGKFEVPIGQAFVRREGSDVTLVGWGLTLHLAMDAARQLAEQGISAEVIDLVSLVPMDIDTVLASVRKTGRLVVIDEDYSNCGVAAEVIARVVESDFPALKAAPRRVCFPDIPVPYARPMETAVRPSTEKTVAAVFELLRD